MEPIIKVPFLGSVSSSSDEKQEVDDFAFHVVPNDLRQIMHDQILRYTPANNVLRIDADSFDPHDNQQFEWQLRGNHFTFGITLSGFIRLLAIIGWDRYNIQERTDHETLSWLTDPEKNGYDLTKVVIPAYMKKIRLPHLSLVEAIASQQVAELLCLKNDVGLADAFLSHVQKLPLTTMIQSMQDAEDMYERELTEDRSTTALLREEALKAFCLANKAAEANCVDELLLKWAGSWVEFDAALQEKYGSNPGLANTTVRKTGRPRYFIDYACIRQCLSGDFTLDRVVDAIAEIGITVAELGADLEGDTALLRRTFCVLESFATIKANGQLLVCGPALRDRATTMELAQLALANNSTSKCYKEVINCASSSCRWKEEEDNIKRYIEQSVGFDRTDRVVLAAIVNSCVLKAADDCEQMSDGGASMLQATATMLFEVGDYRSALALLLRALAKQEAAFGMEAIETAETVFMIGKCYNEMMWEEQEVRKWHERSLRLTEKHVGADHVATARILICIGNTYIADRHWTKALSYCRLAIARIEAAPSPEEHADTHADALCGIGGVYGCRAMVEGFLSMFWAPAVPRLLWLFMFLYLLAEGVFRIVVSMRRGAASFTNPNFLLPVLFTAVVLYVIASFARHWRRAKQSIRYFKQSLLLHETAQGARQHATAEALSLLSTMYRGVFQNRKSMELELQVLEMHDKTRGPLSSEAGDSCSAIATAHFHSGRYSQAATYSRRATEASVFNWGCDAKDANACREQVHQAVAGMLYWSACCCCCGVGGGGGKGARSRAEYLEEIEEHDAWLEKDARQRGENTAAWRRKVLWKRRQLWFLATFVICLFGYGAVSLANLIRKRAQGCLAAPGKGSSC
jgi:tetratricopeptide (TPR) repeat protein